MNTINYNALAHGIWPDAEWIDGEGPYATLAFCGGLLTVELHSTEEIGRDAFRRLTNTACGGKCVFDHALVAIEADSALRVIIAPPAEVPLGRAYHGQERENQARQSNRGVLLT